MNDLEIEVWAGVSVKTYKQVKNKIKELIDGEDKTKPYTDDKLCEKLQKLGLKVARRDIGKYRQVLGVETCQKRQEYVAPSSRKCKTCEEVFDIEQFPIKTRGRDGKMTQYRYHCKSCWYKMERERRAKKRPPKPELNLKEGYMLCSVCDQELPEEEFSPSHRGRNKKGRCKSCLRKINMKRYREDEEKREWFRQYYQKNKEKIKEEIKDYKKKNRDKINSSVTRKIRKSQAKRVKQALARADSDKELSTLEYLGCTAKELKVHIESQFTEGMNWDNYGFYGWHIDHIKPLCQFDITDLEEQKKAFHYTNLQPLWAEENLKKGGGFRDSII